MISNYIYIYILLCVIIQLYIYIYIYIYITVCYKTEKIPQRAVEAVLYSRDWFVFGEYILVTTQIKFIIPHKSANSLVSPEVRGFFKRNIFMQLVKNGVTQDLLLMKVRLMALFTVQLVTG